MFFEEHEASPHHESLEIRARRGLAFPRKEAFIIWSNERKDLPRSPGHGLKFEHTPGALPDPQDMV